MDEYRVAILTAGYGSRLRTQANRSHKALLRVGDKAVISHIVDIFPSGTTFVIGVGHNAHLIQGYLNIVHSDKKFIYIASEYGPGYGPGYSLSKCCEHLQRPFFYFDCDTIIKDFEIDLKENWVGCANIPCETAGQYCTILVNAETKLVTGYMDKTDSGTDLAWTGSAFVKDYAQFWESLASHSTLTRGERQITPALFSLPGLRAKYVEWYDTGNEVGLAIARDAFATVGNLGRHDEEIFFHNGYVIKYYEDATRLQKIVVRMKGLRHLMPEVIRAGKHFLKYRYTAGVDMSRVESLDEHIGEFLKCCESYLWEEVTLPASGLSSFKALCLRFYRDKMAARVKDAFAKLRIVDRETWINGRRVPALQEILLSGIDWDLITDGIPSSFHGDLNLSNVILTPDRGFALVDCREDFGGNLQCGDRYYDLAKIYQSLLWPHDSVRRKAYHVEQTAPQLVTVSIDLPRGIAKARELFDGWALARGYDLRKIQLISAMTLVNIAALHDSILAEHLLFYGWHCLYDFTDSKT